MKAMQDCMNVKSFNEISTYLCKEIPTITN